MLLAQTMGASVALVKARSTVRPHAVAPATGPVARKQVAAVA